jgi:hypothetical protein
MNVLNAAVVAGWHLHCQVLGAKALSHLEFRRQVTLTLIRVQTTTALSLVVVHRALCQSQFSLKELVTFLHRVDTDAVVFVKKKKNIRVMCIKCKARLHTDRGKHCFAQFHAQQKDI